MPEKILCKFTKEEMESYIHQCKWYAKTIDEYGGGHRNTLSCATTREITYCEKKLLGK